MVARITDRGYAWITEKSDGIVVYMTLNPEGDGPTAVFAQFRGLTIEVDPGLTSQGRGPYTVGQDAVVVEMGPDQHIVVTLMLAHPTDDVAVPPL